MEFDEYIEKLKDCSDEELSKLVDEQKGKPGWTHSRANYMAALSSEQERRGLVSAKKILYVDMDNVLVDFPSAFPKIDKEVFDSHTEKDDIPGIFSLMEPIEGAIEAFEALSKHYNAYILSTSPWDNSSAWSDKVEWVKKYLGDVAYKRLILTHHKDLNKGHYLIDDRTKNGASEFEGELIQFGSEEFPDWESILRYLLPLKKWKIIATSLIGNVTNAEYIVEARTSSEASSTVALQMANEERDGFLLDSPAQIFTIEEVKETDTV